MSKKYYFLMNDSQSIFNINSKIEGFSILNGNDYDLINDSKLLNLLFNEKYFSEDLFMISSKMIFQNDLPKTIMLKEYFLNRLKIEIDDDLDYFDKEKIIYEFYLEFYNAEKEFLADLPFQE